MTKLLVWPDATYLDADEYNEVEFNHKGDDYTVIDLQEIAAGRTTLVETGGFFTVVPVFEYRLSELLQAEHQLKALTSMFHNYRTTMREYSWQIPHLKSTIEQQQKDYDLALRRITDLEASPPSAEVRRLSKEMADLIASKEQEIKTILAARDQWVKELQGKLREAISSDSEELLEENRRLKSQLAGATARIRKQVDGYGRPRLPEKTATEAGVRPLHGAQAKLAEWKRRTEAAEAELAKLKNTSAISSDIEDNLRKERDRYATLLAKHGVCTDCGDMYEHHEDEPLASCSCQTAEWPEAPQTPYMLMQRRARELEESNAEAESFAVQELKSEIAEMKRNASAAIAMLQEIE